MSDKFLLIDYENIQKVNLSDVPDNTLVRIFVGQSQKNIPFELVQQAQRFGQSIEWIKIEGQGSNALDFHIAFYYGKAPNRTQEGFLYNSCQKTRASIL